MIKGNITHYFASADKHMASFFLDYSFSQNEQVSDIYNA